MAASILVTAMVASGSTFLALSPQQHDAVENAVVAGHIRSLMAPQPADVASSDRHTVKPWFNGRIPQAPRVVDLANDDFPLLGGRLDVVGRTAVPTLVYRHAKHIISLTAVPTGDVKLVIDGRTATNAPSGIFFPEMVMDLNIQAGQASTVMGSMGSTQEQAANAAVQGVYLPRLQTSTRLSIPWA